MKKKILLFITCMLCSLSLFAQVNVYLENLSINGVSAPGPNLVVPYGGTFVYGTIRITKPSGMTVTGTLSIYEKPYSWAPPYSLTNITGLDANTTWTDNNTTFTTNVSFMVVGNEKEIFGWLSTPGMVYQGASWYIFTELYDNWLTSGNQSIGYGQTPGTITGTSPLGGNGSQYNFQWEYSTNGGSTWSIISGATSQNYSPSALYVTTIYRRKCSSGPVSDYTDNNITITVAPFTNNTLPIVLNPTGQTSLLIDGTTVLSGYGPVTYQWQIHGFGPLPSWTNLPSPNGTAEDFTATILTSGVKYRRIAYAGSYSVISNVCYIATTAVVNNDIPSYVSFNTGQASVTIIGTDAVSPYGTVTYQWERIGGLTTVWTAISGATSRDLTVSSPAHGFQYRRVASVPSYPSNTSNICTLNETGPITGNNIPYKALIQNPVVINAPAATSAYGTVTYQWQWKGGPAPTWTNIPAPAGTSEDLSTTLITNSAQYRRIAKVGTTYTHTSNVCILSSTLREGVDEFFLVEHETLSSYPNPSISGEVVTIAIETPDDYVVKVLDVNGIEIYHTCFSGQYTEIEFSAAKGIYLIVLENKNGDISKKIKHVIQ